MKTRECVKNPEDSPMYRLGRHWNTIQAYLIPGIEDDIGELGEDLKRFTQTCELLINDAMFAKYRWCGNGRPPHSRVSLFKAYILKVMRNYPYTTTLIAAIRGSPSIRRLCGWESVSDIPHGTNKTPWTNSRSAMICVKPRLIEKHRPMNQRKSMHAQIVAALRGGILDGTYRNRLPSETQIFRKFGCARKTATFWRATLERRPTRRYSSSPRRRRARNRTKNQSLVIRRH